jgi:hypothetical protein
MEELAASANAAGPLQGARHLKERAIWLLRSLIRSD